MSQLEHRIFLAKGPYSFREKTVYFQFWDRIISVKTVRFICGPKFAEFSLIIFIIILMFPNALFPISNSMFPISDVCFQYTNYVSKRLFMFPISNLCFQYPMYVSKWKWCFQTTMFPMYVSNIHRALGNSNIKLETAILTWKRI